MDAQKMLANKVKIQHIEAQAKSIIFYLGDGMSGSIKIQIQMHTHVQL
jgi:alkaline phosphatase